MDTLNELIRWIVPLFPLMVFVVTLYIWRQNQKKGKRQGKSDLIIPLLSLYITLMAGQLSIYQSNLSTRVDLLEGNIIDRVHTMEELIGTLNIRVLTNPSESEINSEINSKISREPINQISYSRLFVVPGSRMGVGLEDDFIFGRIFFATPFPMKYLVGFSWDGKESKALDEEWQRTQMLNFLFSILTYEKWQDFGSKSVLKKFQAFHLPVSRHHENWIVAGKKNIGAISYIKGMWERNAYPMRSSVLVVEQEEISQAIGDEMTFFHREAIEHLVNELRKANRWERCPCTIFAGVDPHSGLEPISLEVLVQRTNELKAMFTHNAGTSIEPYSLRTLESIVLSLTQNN